MSELIKLQPGIEGAEVRDALQWVKHITEENINRMKIGKTGFLFSFVDPQHYIAGKVFVPSTTELWHHEKEAGFNAKRLFNAFSIFKRKDKTELYIKEHRLFLKNGALKWRYDLEDIEAAQKIEFDNIPTPAITLRLEDILPLKQVNKGKRVSEKKELVAFKYERGKATIFVADMQGNNRIEIGKVKTEGEGEGIALYNLVYLEKLLKDAKAGIVRIEEGKPLKLNARTGKKTKVVLYLAAIFDEDMMDEIRGEGAPSPIEEDKWIKEQVKKDNDVINGKSKEEDCGGITELRAEVERIQEEAETVERENIEKAFEETEEVVEQWKKVVKEHPNLETEGFKTKELREEVVKEGVTFLTVREATGAKFHNPKDVYDNMLPECRVDRECVWVLHLNNQNKVMKKELVAMGNGNAAQITGREIFRRAIIEGATNIIMVHNHPGGDPEPSEADKVVSARIRDAGKLIGIKLLDFMIIAADGYTSFADEGLLDVLRREG